MSAEQDFDLSGELLEGRYLVKEALGRGGMATVFLANDQRLDRLVVVKVPHPWYLMMEGFRERFQAEIRSLTRVDHPHIVKVLDVGEVRELPFAVMQYLRGGCLKDRMGSPMTWSQIAQWLPQISGALDFVHTQNVVHRDVKPGNILFDEHDNVFLADFGIAKALGAEDTGLTQTGASPGTPGYMAPEIGTNPKVGPEYDQYSLGVVVYQALTGQLPHGGETPIAMMLDKMNRPATPVLDLAPGMVPNNCSKSVMRALSTQPTERFTSCREFANSFCSDAPTASGLEDPSAATMTQLKTHELAAANARTDSARPPADGAAEGAATAGAKGRRSWMLVGAVVLAVVGIALIQWAGDPDDGGQGDSSSGEGAEVASIGGKGSPEGPAGPEAADPKAGATPATERPGPGREGDAPDGGRGSGPGDPPSGTGTPARPPVLSLDSPTDEQRVTDAPLVVRGSLLRGRSAVTVVVTEREQGAAGPFEVSQRLDPQPDGSFAWQVPLTRVEARYRVRVETEGVDVIEHMVEVGTGPKRRSPPRILSNLPVPASERSVRFELSFDETTVLMDEQDVILARLQDGRGEVRLPLPARLTARPGRIEYQLFPKDERGHRSAPFEVSAQAYDAQALALELRTQRPDRDAQWATMAFEQKRNKVLEWEKSVAEVSTLLAPGVSLLEEAGWAEARATLAEPRLPEGFEPIGGELGGDQWCRRIEDPRNGMRFVLIEPKTGSLHPAAPYYLSEAEVTVAQWESYAKATGVVSLAEKEGGRTFLGDRFGFEQNTGANWRHPFPAWPHVGFDPAQPVTLINHDEARAYCTHHGYRLPSEREWEFAARAGGHGQYWWGDAPEGAAGKENLRDATLIPDGTGGIPWKDGLPSEDDFAFLAPVRSFEPNALGLYDMLGNAAEMCADAFDDSAEHKAMRGGTFHDRLEDCVIESRRPISPDRAVCSLGFRVALDLAGAGH